MLWMLWVLVVPVLGAWWALLALGRAAGKGVPEQSLISTRELPTRADLSRRSSEYGVPTRLVEPYSLPNDHRVQPARHGKQMPHRFVAFLDIKMRG